MMPHSLRRVAPAHGIPRTASRWVDGVMVHGGNNHAASLEAVRDGALKTIEQMPQRTKSLLSRHNDGKVGFQASITARTIRAPNRAWLASACNPRREVKRPATYPGRR